MNWLDVSRPGCFALSNVDVWIPFNGQEPLVLTEHQRLTNGTVGEVILFRKMRATFKDREIRSMTQQREVLLGFLGRFLDMAMYAG